MRITDVALVYYSGHAMQFGGFNYLMPVDPALHDEADLRRLTRVDEIVADLKQAKNLRILVLEPVSGQPAGRGTKSFNGTNSRPPGRSPSRKDCRRERHDHFVCDGGRTDGRRRARAQQPLHDSVSQEYRNDGGDRQPKGIAFRGYGNPTCKHALTAPAVSSPDHLLERPRPAIRISVWTRRWAESSALTMMDQ
jgi:hypothetical protein